MSTIHIFTKILQGCERVELGEVDSYLPLELIVTKISDFCTRQNINIHIFMGDV